VDRTGLGSYPTMNFCISGVEPPGIGINISLISKMNLREIGCEDKGWMELISHPIMDFAISATEPSGSGSKPSLVNAGILKVTTSEWSSRVQKQVF
jgi:hypothetical protein